MTLEYDVFSPCSRNNISLSDIYPWVIAPVGHTETQAPQDAHESWSTSAIVFLSFARTFFTALYAQTSSHRPQPIQRSESTEAVRL